MVEMRTKVTAMTSRVSELEQHRYRMLKEQEEREKEMYKYMESLDKEDGRIRNSLN